MNDKLKILLLLIPLLLMGGCRKFGSGSISFSNHSTNTIWVENILCDGEVFPAPCGHLGPGGAKSTALMFPDKFPRAFTIEYEKNGEKISQDVPADASHEAIKKAKPAEEVTLHFIYSDQNSFILKIYFDRGDSLKYGGELWPDENDPVFVMYKELVQSAYEGDAEKVNALHSHPIGFSF